MWNKKVLMGAGVGLALMTGVVGLGVASAQTPPPSGNQGQPTPRQQLLDRFAQNLGTTPDKVTDAWKQAALAQVDQLLKDNKITQDQANKLKERINSAQGLPFEFRGGKQGNHDRRAPVEQFLRQAEQALANWIGGGVTPQDITTARKNGQSLAEFAQSKGKTEPDLIQFIQQRATAAVDQAVKDNKLTADQATKLKSEITPDRIKKLVEAKRQPGQGLGLRLGQGRGGNK